MVCNLNSPNFNMISNKHPDQNNIPLNVNGTNILLKSCVKLLGVFIDYEFTFSEHVNYICKRTSRQLNTIRTISKYLKRDCLMKLFHAFVASNFNYCPTTWHFTSKSCTMKIDNKAALRVVYNDYTRSFAWLLDMSNRTPLFFARLKGLLVEVFQFIRGLNPNSWTQHLSWIINLTTPAVDHPSLKTVLKPSNMVFNHLPIKELNVGIFSR